MMVVTVETPNKLGMLVADAEDIKAARFLKSSWIAGAAGSVV